MGAKAPTDKTAGADFYKCEFCGRTLLSATSLRSHQQTLHSQALKERVKRRITRSKGSTNVSETLKAPKTPKATPNEIKPMKKAGSNSNANKIEKTTENLETTNTKASNAGGRVVFGCPYCVREFHMYFSAVKHIEKEHLSEGNTIATSLKPVELQCCEHCNKKTKSNEQHICPELIKIDAEDEMMSLWCASCDQTFPTAKIFDAHVKLMHSSDVESMYFNNKDEFFAWQSDMEAQTQCTYYVMAQYNNKNIYRCSEHILDSEDPFLVRFCPSMLIYQEFSKGIQIQYFKEHSDHECEPYVLKPEFSSSCLTEILKQAQNYTEIENVQSDEDDVYLQFKTLMHGIVCDSAKLKVDSLKLLIGKALAMTKLLTGFVDDDDCVVKSVEQKKLVAKLTKNVSPRAQIVTNAKLVLDSPSTRKSTNDQNFKKIHQDTPRPTQFETLMPTVTPRTQNLSKSNFSLSNDKDSNKILKELLNDTESEERLLKRTKDNVENNQTVIQSPILPPKRPHMASPSFNDSYKDFLGNNCLDKPRLKRTRNSSPSVKNTPTPAKNSPQPVKNTPEPVRNTPEPVKNTPKPVKNTPTAVKNASKGVKNTPTAVKTKPTAVKNTPTPIKNKPTPVKDAPIPVKDAPIPVKDAPIPVKKTPVPVKSAPVKTKIGQFKPNVPHKKPNKIAKPRRSSANKIKDVNYEVKERDNDCNILILKI